MRRIELTSAELTELLFSFARLHRCNVLEKLGSRSRRRGSNWKECPIKVPASFSTSFSKWARVFRSLRSSIRNVSIRRFHRVYLKQFRAAPGWFASFLDRAQTIIEKSGASSPLFFSLDSNRLVRYTFHIHTTCDPSRQKRWRNFNDSKG